ncbi:hypothetical protein [Cytobacillus gottheilii]|uniref:hypothetical protein n=1 Tax=Cytobacillus gottheilii TaxID=859144 RepID=UPI0009BA3E34|nr:hypothetical protein [Cytobacillus gottheilii]
MKKLISETQFDKEFTRLEQDMEWDYDRAQQMKYQIHSSVKRLQIRRVIGRGFSAAAAVVFMFTVYFFIQMPLLEEKSEGTAVTAYSLMNFYEGEDYVNEYSNNLKRTVLTDQGISKTVYPLDLHKTSGIITGEPSIVLNILERGDKKTYETQAFYPTVDKGEIRIHTQRHDRNKDKVYASLLPHEKFPAKSYDLKELSVAGHKAILKTPAENMDHIAPALYVVSDHYLYYFHWENQYGKEHLQITADDVIQVAASLRYNKE